MKYLLTLLLLAQSVPPVIAVNGEEAVSLSVSVSPSTVRAHQAAKVQVRMRNPRTNETIQLQATATYTDSSGNQQTSYSNVVTLTIDRAVPLRLTIPAPQVRLVENTAKFDGALIQPVVGTASIEFQINLAGDGQDHVLELDVIRR